MTKIAKTFTLEEIETFISEATDSLTELNDQFTDHYAHKPITDENGVKRQLSADEVDALHDRLDSAQKTLNGYEEMYKYKKLRLAENPMMAALLNPSFTVTKLKKKTPDKNAPSKFYYEIGESEKCIDLLTLKKECKKDDIEIGIDPDWPAMLDNLNYTMYAHVAYRINAGVVPRVDFKMSKLADKIDMALKGNTNEALPVSKRTVDRDLNACVKALVGDQFTATKHDYEALMLSYLTKDKKSLLGFKSRKSGSDFDYLFLCMMHRIVTDGKYTISVTPRKK